jgi:hypothetical protein
MATTTNYGWTTPDDTALVKDGASAIRTLGTSVDTTTKNLNPSTTLGDIEYRSSTANTNTRLGIGTSGQVLSVSGGVPAWTTASSGGMTSLASGSLGSSGTTLSSISGSYVNLILYVKDYIASTAARPRVRLNGITTATYDTTNVAGQTSFDISGTGDNPPTTGQGASYTMQIFNYANAAGWKNVSGVSAIKGGFTGQWGGFANTITTAITQIEIFPSTGTISAGTYELFGVK